MRSIRCCCHKSCQAKLGMAKNMREYTIILEDYGEELEVVRQAGTGLFMIRIHHLPSGGYTDGGPLLEELFIDSGVNDSDLEVEHIDGGAILQ